MQLQWLLTMLVCEFDLIAIPAAVARTEAAAAAAAVAVASSEDEVVKSLCLSSIFYWMSNYLTNVISDCIGRVTTPSLST